MAFPKSRMDFVDIVSKQFEENPDYENVNVIMGADGLMVEYDIKKAPEPDPVLLKQVRAIVGSCEIPSLASQHQKEFYPYPSVGCGRLEALLSCQYL